jgi:hypothetical protein
MIAIKFAFGFKMNNMISLFTYTHTNCIDLWEPYLDSLDLYLPNISSTVAANKFYEDYGRHRFVSYDDDGMYCQEMIKCVNENIDTDYFIYMQEDFFLYDKVNVSLLKDYVSVLENTDFSFVRLLKCGHVTNIKHTDTLYLVSESGSTHQTMTAFSMQPTIWKKKDFLRLYQRANCAKFKENWEYTLAMNSLNMNGLYHYNGERQIGGHYDSSVFPYIATAVVRGKWNTVEYGDLLEPIFAKYEIDKSERGEL